MKPTEQTCDRSRIDDYLEERLNESALVEFEKHLSTCDSCQIEIQRRAAEPEVWQDAVHLLGDAVSESSLHSDQQRSDGQRQRYVLSVLDSLTPTDDPEMLGRIDDYEISGVVGVGGMGAVLKGFDKSLRRVVAIKVMAPHLANSGSARTRFQREARAAAAITHDNVIDTYGVSEANGLPYIAMPFARGPSLQQRIDESGPLTPIEVVRIGRQIASGLAAAHEQGLVHRDIKPANILLNEGIERLWITDFGVARAMDDASMTRTGVIAGTPQYMSPEQARGESVDQRSDLFSMGSVLYTACTGRPPFRSEAAYGILRRITDTDPRLIREINPDIPEWLCQVIERLMAKHPADRFQSAGEVAELFERCLAHLQQPTQIDLPQCITLPPRDDNTFLPHSERRKRQTNEAAELRSFRFQRTGVWIMVSLLLLAGMSFAALQLTQPMDIAGDWAGENWKDVTLSSVEEATDWYTGAFTDSGGRRGALQLEWSRLQRRYNGRWKVGDGQSGSLTLRVDNGELRGAVSVDPDSPITSSIARLREFSWQRAPARAMKVDDALRVTKSTGPPTSIEAPLKGRVLRWGVGVYENARLKKGDLIAEIADLDPAYRNRLKEQSAASTRHVEAAQALVQANERNLEAAETIIASSQKQVLTYEQVTAQVVAAAKASVGAAKNKIEAEKAELVARNSSLNQAQADLDRQKKLFDENVISQLKLQEAMRKLDEAKAKSTKAESLVKAAENELVSLQNGQKAKESKTQGDVNHASARLRKAMGDVAKMESEVANANLELTKAQNGALELQATLSESGQTTQKIYAPFDGFVTKITGDAVLKEGDLICLIWPDTAQSEAGVQADASTNAIPPQPKSSLPSAYQPDNVAGGSSLSAISGLPIMEEISAATSLGWRFRAIRTKLRYVEQTEASQASVARLSKDLTAAESQRTTFMSILNSQLEAANKQSESQGALSKMVKRSVEQGREPPDSLRQAEQAVVTTSAEIRQFELLLGYYENLGREKPTSPEDENHIAIEVLKVKLDAARQSLNFQAEQKKFTRRRFEVGDTGLDSVLKTEQAEATATAEVRKVEALLAYYANVDMNDVEPNARLQDVQDNSDVLVRPKTEKERQALVEILSARLDATTARLAQARQAYERQNSLFEQRITSSAKVEAARSAVAQLEAAVKVLKIENDYYRSGPVGK